MKLNIQQIKTLQDMVNRGIPVTKLSSEWLREFQQEESIGLVKGNKIEFDYQSLKKITLFLESNNYPLEFDDSVLNSRIDTAGKFKEEKLAKAVTHNRLFVNFPKKSVVLDGQALPIGRAIDISVSEMYKVNPSQIVLIENLEVFLKIGQHQQVSDLLKEDAVFIYRGGKGFYSPRGTVKFFKEFKGERIGFFDFEPAGVCCLGHAFIDQIVVPDLDLESHYWSVCSSEALFLKQLHSYSSRLNELILQDTERAMYAKHIRSNRLGITQEKMMSDSLPLKLIKTNI